MVNLSTKITETTLVVRSTCCKTLKTTFTVNNVWRFAKSTPRGCYIYAICVAVKDFILWEVALFSTGEKTTARVVTCNNMTRVGPAFTNAHLCTVTLPDCTKHDKHMHIYQSTFAEVVKWVVRIFPPALPAYTKCVLGCLRRRIPALLEYLQAFDLAVSSITMLKWSQVMSSADWHDMKIIFFFIIPNWMIRNPAVFAYQWAMGKLIPFMKFQIHRLFCRHKCENKFIASP